MRREARAALAATGAAALAAPAAAHAGSLRLSGEPTSVPLWLVLLTGGGVIGASFLVASLVTDHDLIRSINRRRVALPWFPRGSVAVRGVRAASVLVLALIVALGLSGPQSATANFAILVVWAGWWAGYTMSVYLVGNTWPAVDPWRALASLLPERGRPYPEHLGAWPSVVGLLGLVWLEVVTPVASDPRLLAGVVVAYTVATLAGATVYGPGTWFDRVDPIARLFRTYGRIAPLQRTPAGIELTLPGVALTREAGREDVHFVIALLWATTYDGLVSTPLWADAIRAVVPLGVPALVVYLAVMVAGFWVFLRVYGYAARTVRETAGSYVAPAVVRDRFVTSLLPIAAGYHVAHFLGYFLSLTPALFGVLASPLDPAAARVLVLPAWFGALKLLLVLAGHVFGVWIAHSTAFELFTGRLQPIRSQYPLVAAMVFYTMTSMWIVAQPFTQPPYV